MKTKNRIFHAEAIEAATLILLLIIFLLTGIGLSASFAQSPSSKSYKGFEGNFGVRSFAIQSNIPEISNLEVTVEGGNAGLIFGNEVVRTKIHLLGFYYASANVGRTIDLFELEGLVNFFPLQIGKGSSEKGISPYLISGFTQDNVKFSGHYLDKSDAKINYSDIDEPYLGKIMLSSATVGLGINWKLKKEDFVERSFVHLFGEVKYGIPLLSRTDRVEFAHTSINNCLAVNVGVCFGAYR